MAGTRTKDLTEGPAIPLIISFSLPLIMGNMFQQFYNLVDTIIVGRYLGITELAAVGSTTSLNFLILGFFNGLCGGMCIPVAQAFGAKDENALRHYVMNAAYLGIICSLIFSPMMAALAKPFLRFIRTPEDIIDSAAVYITIIFAGIPFAILYNLVANIIRALGDSRTPLYFLILASALNIVLDLMTIVVFHMGVAGPALATVFSQGVSGFLCLLFMRSRYPILRMTSENRRFSGATIGKLFSLGAPMGLQYSVTAIGSVILQSSVNGLGSLAVAATTGASRIQMVTSNCVLDSLGASMATYSGQNYGARRYDRIVDGVKKALLIGTAYSLFAFVVLYFGVGPMSRLFISDPSQTEVLGMIREIVFHVSLFLVGLNILSVLRFSIQGLGYSMIAVAGGGAEMVARIIIGLVMIPRFGFAAVCYSNPLAWVLADLTFIPCFLWVLKRVRVKLQLSTGPVH